MGAKLTRQSSFPHSSSLSHNCDNQIINASNENFESMGKLKVTDRGAMLRRVGSIRLGNRKNVSCEFSIYRSSSVLSRSSSGSFDMNGSLPKFKGKDVERNEKQNRNSNCSHIENASITVDTHCKTTFDRAIILRTTSRGAKLLRGESLRRNHEM